MQSQAHTSTKPINPNSEGLCGAVVNARLTHNRAPLEAALVSLSKKLLSLLTTTASSIA